MFLKDGGSPLAIATVLLGCLVAGDALAAAGVEEIVVSATRREENLQDVPISITAFSADQLNRIGAASLRDLEYSVPNFNFAGNDFNRRPDIALRGISATVRNPGEDGSIGFYVDGVFMARPTDWNLDVGDLERIEILRGPQGTLFGKNTIAGAINMITRKPGEEFGAKLDVEYGNLNHKRVRASVDMPLIEGKLLSRLSINWFDRDGYVKNVFDGSELQSEDRIGGRLQLRVLPTENVTIDISGDYMEEDPSRIMREVITSANPLIAIPGPYTVNYDRQSRNERTLAGGDITINADFDGHTLTSITAYRDSYVNFEVDEDQGPLDDQRTKIVDENSSFSQELRWASPVNDYYDFVAGLYYLHVTATQGNGGFIEHGADSAFFPGGTTAQREVRSSSYAAFGNFNLRPIDRITLNLGLRIGYEEKQMNFSRTNYNGGFFGGVFADLPLIADTYTDVDISPSAALEYKATEEINTYVKWARGNKSGGWNAGLSFRGAAPFDAEQVDSYEAGVKADLFDNRARLNVAVFQMDYSDLQVTSFGGLSNGVGFNVENAAQARIRGVEADFVIVPTEGLEITGGVGYLDTEYVNYQTSVATSNNGNRLQYAPDWSSSLSALYTRPIGDGLELSVNGQWTYRGSLFGDAANTPTTRVDPYHLFNARIGISSPDDGWQLSIWGKNLADNAYLVSASTSGGDVWGIYGMPRTYGVSAAIQF